MLTFLMKNLFGHIGAKGEGQKSSMLLMLVPDPCPIKLGNHYKYREPYLVLFEC